MDGDGEALDGEPLDDEALDGVPIDVKKEEEVKEEEEDDDGYDPSLPISKWNRPKHMREDEDSD